jgi:ADP-heptose:LPS heptosyltransferase
VTAGLADATHHLEHGTMAKLFVPGAVLDEALLDWLRSFNLVVSYLYDPDGIVRGNMERIGVRTFLECPHRVEPGKGHAAAQLAAPLERLAMFLEDSAPRIAPPDEANRMEGTPVIAIHPGSGSLKKNWPVERWIEAGLMLAADRVPRRLALITGEAEHERGITAKVAAGWSGIDFLHWDMLPLGDLAARLASVAAFIGHDSGISHLAAACGAPSLLFFGPTDPETWAPRNPGVQVHVEPSGDLARLPLDAGLDAMKRFLAKVLPS